jgi:putative ABC transport system substrate-binding protein
VNVLAAKKATSVIPIVFASVADPVANNVVESLARPGGNVTGLSAQISDVAGKRLELLREIIPGLRQLVIMANVDNPSAVLETREVEGAARALGLEAAIFELRQADDVASAISALRDRADAPYVQPDPSFTTNRALINASALKARLPTMHGTRELPVEQPTKFELVINLAISAGLVPRSTLSTRSPARRNMSCLEPAMKERELIAALGRARAHFRFG